MENEKKEEVKSTNNQEKDNLNNKSEISKNSSENLKEENFTI